MAQRINLRGPPKARANVLGVTSSPFWESREQVEVRAGPEKNCGPGGHLPAKEPRNSSSRISSYREGETGLLAWPWGSQPLPCLGPGKGGLRLSLEAQGVTSREGGCGKESNPWVPLTPVEVGASSEQPLGARQEGKWP